MSLLTDTPTVRSATAMPPLLQRLSERRPEQLDYLGVSYGLTPQFGVDTVLDKNMAERKCPTCGGLATLF